VVETCLSAHRPSSKGTKLLFQVIKAIRNKVKTPHTSKSVDSSGCSVVTPCGLALLGEAVGLFLVFSSPMRWFVCESEKTIAFGWSTLTQWAFGLDQCVASILRQKSIELGVAIFPERD